ncbi:MAG: RlpA-like double-psi beta-barrel domain-containing protein [Thermoleophilaceae bacterium]
MSPHLWALAAALCTALALSAPAAAQTGGLSAPSPGEGAEPVDPEFKISARRSVYLGREMRVKGSAPQAAGKAVRIEWLDPAGAWQPAATVQADAQGAFMTTWEPEHVGRYKLRAVLGHNASSAQAQAARSSVPRTLTVYRSAKASWYGPGFYGNRTACGQRLRRGTVGIAHRRLKCGTRVAVRRGRRSMVVRVIDRGPYVRGVHWDLTEAAARKLGVEHTTRIGAAPLG